MYNYEEFLTRKLNTIKTELGYEDLTLEIATEQAFSKKKNLLPNTVYIVIKYLTADISYGAIAQPVQILCLSEQNSLEKTRLIFTKFAEDNNFLAEINNGVFTKHQYTTPVVLSNYEEVGYGYRSVLYMTATLNILENVLDVKNLTIDGESVSQLAFNLSYQMTPNTQQKASETIASSAKSTANVRYTSMTSGQWICLSRLHITLNRTTWSWSSRTKSGQDSPRSTRTA